MILLKKQGYFGISAFCRFCVKFVDKYNLKRYNNIVLIYKREGYLCSEKF